MHSQAQIQVQMLHMEYKLMSLCANWKTHVHMHPHIYMYIRRPCQIKKHLTFQLQGAHLEDCFWCNLRAMHRNWQTATFHSIWWRYLPVLFEQSPGRHWECSSSQVPQSSVSYYRQIGQLAIDLQDWCFWPVQDMLQMMGHQVQRIQQLPPLLHSQALTQLPNSL